MGVKAFTPLRNCFPERLVAEIRRTPPGAVCYCLHTVPDTGDARFILFVKMDYSQVQPVVDADSVPAEFSLEVAQTEPDGGFALTVEFAPAEAEPLFACIVRAEFPWADPDAIRCFQVLLEQPVWPFVFVTEDNVYILAQRTYENPTSEEDRELCRQLIAEQQGA
jgi:hypothetical protein